MQTPVEIALPYFSTDTRIAKPTAHVRFIGSAEHRATDELDRYLPALHSIVRNEQIEEVTVALDALEFMNSSSLHAVIAWLDVIRRSEPSERYRVRLIIDAKRPWQRRSFRAVAAFATGIVEVAE